MSAVTKLMTAGGGGVSLTPASSIASDVTVNVPSQNCTLGIQGPAFSAYASGNTTLANGTFTKIAFATKEFDTNSNFDNVTNYRFTPTVSGYYQVSSQLDLIGSTGNNYIVSIFKNNSEFKRGAQVAFNPVGNVGVCISALVFLNGSTDYVEIYGFQGSGLSQTLSLSSPYNNWFQAALVRAA